MVDWTPNPVSSMYAKRTQKLNIPLVTMFEKKNKTYQDDRSLKVQSTWVTSTQRDDGFKLIETRLVHIAPKLRKGQEANADQKIFSITTLAETTPGFFSVRNHITVGKDNRPHRSQNIV